MPRLVRKNACLSASWIVRLGRACPVDVRETPASCCLSAQLHWVGLQLLYDPGVHAVGIGGGCWGWVLRSACWFFLLSLIMHLGSADAQLYGSSWFVRMDLGLGSHRPITSMRWRLHWRSKQLQLRPASAAKRDPLVDLHTVANHLRAGAA